MNTKFGKPLFIGSFWQTTLIFKLIESEYQSFKHDFPEEEPFWRISCYRKRDKVFKKGYETNNQSGSINQLEPAILKQTWRRVIVDSEGKTEDEIKVKEPTIVSVIESKVTPYVKLTSVRKSERMFKEIKPHVVLEPKTKEFTCIGIPSDSRIEVVRRIDEPGDLELFSYDHTIASVSKEKIMMFGKPGVNVIAVGDKIESPMLNNPSGIIKLEQELTNKIEEYYNVIKNCSGITPNIVNTIHTLQKQNKELLTEMSSHKEKFSDDIKQVERVILRHPIRKIQTLMNKDLTISDIIDKYIEVQKKLNDLKAKVTPILIKHKKLRFKSVLDEHGFINGLYHIIKYFDDDYDSDNDQDVMEDYF